MSKIKRGIRKVLRKASGHELNMKKMKDIIRKSEYFDAEFYIKKNKDVKELGMDPAEHFLVHGWKEGRNPSFKFNTKEYIEEYPEVGRRGVNPLVHFITEGKDKGYVAFDLNFHSTLEASKLIDKYFSRSGPIVPQVVENTQVRLNAVYNGFDKASAFGGKATALQFAVRLCVENNFILRLVVFNEFEEELFMDLVRQFQLTAPVKVEFFHSTGKRSLEVSDKDYFLATNADNIREILKVNIFNNPIFYLLQEVETFFHDHGDFHLAITQQLNHELVVPIVNTKLLFDYMKNQNNISVIERGVYFEPSFDPVLFKPGVNSFVKKDKYKLFFYARPNHQRNLFYFSLSVLNEAYNRGIIDSEKWEVHISEADTITSIVFDKNVKVVNNGKLSWEKYCSMMSDIDMSFSIMYSPHPSYPPLDMACSGGVALTNNFANKQGLVKYSNNMVTGDLELESMLLAVEKAVAIAENSELREKNYHENKILRSWDQSFAETNKKILEYIKA